MLPVHIIERMTAGQLISHYLLASYCYYELNESPMADATFDRLCVRLIAELPRVKHPHKRLVTRADLDAGTCMIGIKDWPLMVVSAAQSYTALCTSGEMASRLEPLLRPATAAPAIRRIVRTPVAAAVVAAQPKQVPRVVRRPIPAQATPPPAPAPTPGPRRVVRRPITGK